MYSLQFPLLRAISLAVAEGTFNRMKRNAFAAVRSTLTFVQYDRFHIATIVSTLVIFTIAGMSANTPALAAVERNEVLVTVGGNAIVAPVIAPEAVMVATKNADIRLASTTTTVDSGQYTVGTRIAVPMTAYSSTPDQTDSTPFTTASGTHVHWGTVAANFLPFGTKIKIPSMYGDQVFTVEDRMNKRYWHKVDIWMPTRQDALQFGVRTLEIEILEEV